MKRAQTALCDAALALTSGNVAQASARLFQTVIATRVESIPRLTAELHGLARRLDPAAIRQGDRTPVDLLGGLARSFTRAGPVDVAFAGAELWRTLGGARGPTVIFADLTTGRFHRATDARAAGTDLTWDPRGGVASPAVGVCPGWTQRGRCSGTGPRSRPSSRANAEPGSGGGAALAILSPHRTDPPAFDEYAQAWSWDWRDGDTRTLHFPFEMSETPARPADASRRIDAGLVAFDPGDAAPHAVQFARLPPETGLHVRKQRFMGTATARIRPPRFHGVRPPILSR